MKATVALTATLVLGLLAATPAAARHHHCHWVGHGHHHHKVCR